MSNKLTFTIFLILLNYTILQLATTTAPLIMDAAPFVNNVCVTQPCGTGLCNINARCVDGECLCPYSWATFPHDVAVYCCYKQRRQLMAFIVELTCSLGIGHLYIGRYGLGGCKMFAMLSVLFMIGYWLVVKYAYKDSEAYRGPNDSRMKFWIWVFGILYFVWQTVDIVLYALNLHSDRHDVELASWYNW